MRKKLLLIMSAALWAPAAFAADPSSEPSPAAFEASLHYRTGEIELPDGVARLSLAPGWRYLGPEEAERVIEEAWGNPEGKGSLGIVFPPGGAATSPMWAAVVSYEASGHVADGDARTIDYGELLEEMQASTEAENEARREGGFAAMHLVGWATPPSYDPTGHKLYWAKLFKLEGGEQSLNYDIRVLGRNGVLSINAVGAPTDLGAIKTAAPALLAAAGFTPGNAYDDYVEGVDKVAGYGIAGLIAGGVAAKTGLLAKLLALLIAGKKLIAVGAVAAVAGARQFFARRKAKASAES